MGVFQLVSLCCGSSPVEQPSPWQKLNAAVFERAAAWFSLRLVVSFSDDIPACSFLLLSARGADRLRRAKQEVLPGVNPSQLGASSVFPNTLEEARVQIPASSCLPALPCKPAHSVTYGLSVKAVKHRVVTKASMETGALAVLGKKRVRSRTRYQRRRERWVSRAPEAPAARPWGETLLALRRGGGCTAPQHRLMVLCWKGTGQPNASSAFPMVAVPLDASGPGKR